FRIPLFLKDAEYQSFDYSETSNSFMFLGKKLPLGMVHSTYTPFEYKTLSYSAEEADILLQQKLSLYEKNFYDLKGIEVENREIDVKNYSDKMEYSVKYTLVGEIGADYEIYVD
ncbi:MAG: sporulation protein YqfD, partial [Porcipelethomonas sp.]